MRIAQVQATTEQAVAAWVGDSAQRQVGAVVGLNQANVSRRQTAVLDQETSWLESLRAGQLVAILTACPEVLGAVIGAVQAALGGRDANATEALKGLAKRMNTAAAQILEVIAADGPGGTAVAPEEAPELARMLQEMIAAASSCCALLAQIESGS